MPLGFSRKSKDAASISSDTSSSRSFLFGSRSKDKESPTAAQNPYAQQATSPDPYAKPDPYADNNKYGGMGRAFADNRNASQTSVPPPYSPNGGGNGGGYGGMSDKSGAGYGNGDRYGNNGTSYGNQSGYGANRYGDSGDSTSRYGDSGASASRYGPGGYGGLGRRPSQETMDTEAGREALFGQRSPGQFPQPSPAGPAGTDGRDMPGGYGGGNRYEDRQLTAEEEAEEEVQATKDQIRGLKQEGVSRTRNALRVAAEAEETGNDIIARLQRQGEMLGNTEKNLDLASNQNRAAEEKARTLQKLNRSMFVPEMGNPLTSKRREAAREAAILEQHRAERETADRTRAEAYAGNVRRQEYERDQRGGRGGPQQKVRDLNERRKYQFEADSEDEQMEDEIEDNLDEIRARNLRMQQVGLLIGKEVDAQNKNLERIIGKSDNVDMQIEKNRLKLEKIGRG